MKRSHLWISGVVQGVCFRYYTRESAEGLGLCGWVRNLADGRVEALVEGKDASVDNLIRWCNKGPSGARVDKIVVKDEPYRGDLPEF